MLIRLTLAVKNKRLQEYLERRLALPDIRVECFTQSKDMWQKVVRSCGDVIVISKNFLLRPLDHGIALLNNLPENPTTIILNDGDSSEELARLTAAGADLALYSGISKKVLVETIEATFESRRQFFQKQQMGRKAVTPPKLIDFISESEAMQLFMTEVQQVVSGDSPILILGETGVGKEHLARAIHGESPRSNGPFIAVNAAAVPEQLLESELFGHAQGAFTGATRYHRGAFELAHGGTLFLDEIGEMPLHLQAKLLRVLQDYEIKPVGGEESVWVDVRVIAATSRDIEKEILQKNFRKDLYYRLSVLVLTIPPLRERKEDIPGLARRFVNEFRHKINREVTRLSEEAILALCNYEWAGNVRELMNVIERAMLICKTTEITLNDLPHVFHRSGFQLDQILDDGHEAPVAWSGKTLHEVKKEVMDKVEKLYLEMVLTKTRGRIAETAKISGIHPRGLYDKMKYFNLNKETFKTDNSLQGLHKD